MKSWNSYALVLFVLYAGWLSHLLILMTLLNKWFSTSGIMVKLSVLILLFVEAELTMPYANLKVNDDTSSKLED